MHSARYAFIRSVVCLFSVFFVGRGTLKEAFTCHCTCPEIKKMLSRKDLFFLAAWGVFLRPKLVLSTKPDRCFATIDRRSPGLEHCSHF